MSAPTLRTLAKTLGLSRTTISDALRGSPRVKAETVRRVREAAKAAGYEHNPLTGAVMSQLRRSRGQQFRGVLAALEIVEPGRGEHAVRYNEAVLKGIAQRASELGFKMERFELGPGPEGMRLNRLDTILHTRSIQCLVLLPASGLPDLSGLSWERYTAVYTDLFIKNPPLHCVCMDHYRSMVMLLRELHARGYRRPGLFMEISIDERLQYRWEGAFLAIQKYLPNITEVPALRANNLTRDDFLPWFKKYKPDVVLGNLEDAIPVDEKVNARHGLIEMARTVDFAGAGAEPCAALDFQPGQIGARAAELVIGQLLHNEFGIPIQPSLTTIPARFLEGPTLRAAATGG